MTSPAVKVNVFLEVDAELADGDQSLAHKVATMVNDALTGEPAWTVAGVTAETGTAGVGLDVAAIANVED